MSISFNRLPANIRVPLFYAEVDNSQAGYFQRQQRALLIVQMLAAGTFVAGTPVFCPSPAQAKVGGGAGSYLAAMVESYRANDPFGELWVLPIADNGAGVAATGTLTVAGPATGNGTLSTYIAGRRVQTAVASGGSANAIAAALAADINADTDLPVTAAAVNAVVTVSAKHKGTLGNQIDLRMNFRGVPGGEALPAGVTVAVVAMANGATDPVTIAAALANLGDEEFDFIASSFTDTTNLDLLKSLMDDVTGRWAWSRQIYGQVFAAREDSVGNLGTFGAGRNDPHVSIMGFNDSPSPSWVWAAAYAAEAAVSLSIDPARPLQTLPLVGVLAPPPASRFILTERQTLLYDGIATYHVRSDGTVAIDREITTYQVNAFNQPDPSFLDVQPLFQLSYVLRKMRGAITSKYGRHKLADNGTRAGLGQAIVTPNIIKAELIAQYSELEEQGIVENMAAFKEHLIVERNANDPNRIDVLWPGDLVNQLRIFGVLAQFRLQYPATAAA